MVQSGEASRIIYWKGGIMRQRRLLVLLLSALALGIVIAWVDSRPTWDDTGVTAILVFLICGGFGAAAPEYPWLWALAVGAWIPVVGIVQSGNYGSLLAVGIAFLGAYCGMVAQRVWDRARKTFDEAS
jgi:hypothetical protein